MGSLETHWGWPFQKDQPGLSTTEPVNQEDTRHRKGCGSGGWGVMWVLCKMLMTAAPCRWPQCLWVLSVLCLHPCVCLWDMCVSWSPKLGKKIKLYNQTATEHVSVYSALGVRGISPPRTHWIFFSFQLHFKSPSMQCHNYNISLAYSYLHKAVSRFYNSLLLSCMSQFLLWWSSAF